MWIKQMNASEPRVTCRKNLMMTSKPELPYYSGRSSEETCLLSEWCPAYTWHELDLGLCVERGNLLCDDKGKPYKWWSHEGGKYRCMQQGRIIL